MQIGSNYYYQEDGKFFCYSDYESIEVAPELIASELVQYNCRERALIKGFEKVQTIITYRYGGFRKCQTK